MGTQQHTKKRDFQKVSKPSGSSPQEGARTLARKFSKNHPAASATLLILDAHIRIMGGKGIEMLYQ